MRNGRRKIHEAAFIDIRRYCKYTLYPQYNDGHIPVNMSSSSTSTVSSSDKRSAAPPSSKWRKNENPQRVGVGVIGSVPLSVPLPVPLPVPVSLHLPLPLPLPLPVSVGAEAEVFPAASAALLETTVSCTRLRSRAVVLQ